MEQVRLAGHRDRAGQRTFVDVTPDEAQNPSLFKVMPGLETTVTVPEHEPTGDPQQVSNARISA